MNREQRRRAAKLYGRTAAHPGAIDCLGGVPVYDGSAFEVVSGIDALGNRDDRVLIGIGPPGRTPVAYLGLCPCDGAAGFIEELRDAAAIAAEHHGHHG